MVILGLNDWYEGSRYGRNDVSSNEDAAQRI